MDAFHNICKEKLRAADYFFLPAGRHREHQVITITQRQPQGDADLEVDVRDTRIAADQLVHFVNDSRPGNDDIDAGSMKEAHLIIIGMESSVQGGLAIQRDVFEGLLESRVGVDYGAIWPLIQHYDGYHFFPGRNAYSEKETHFFGWAVFAVIWTYDHKTHSTLAFFIHRVYGEFRQINELSDFLPYLVHHKAYATSASFMGYVLGLSLCARLDEYYTDWQHLRKIEGAVGYGYGQKPRRVPGDIDQFTEWLQESGEILINSSGNRRTLRSVGLMLEQVQQTSKNPPLFHFGRQDNVWRRLSEESSTKLIQAIPLISSRIRAHDEYMEYIIVRAERLSAVLFALLTHRDAEVSVRQAEASHEIAEAAKKDSSDMKTIAIMTMAFLPATFLAALFAIPSLDWQSDNVIQSNHWVYWAFTIPATILVFFSWYLLNQRALLRRLRPHNRKNGPSAAK